MLIVINRAYLTSSKYSTINNLSLILHDECHNTTRATIGGTSGS